MPLVALGVCGGIGAYKAVEIARGLQQHGHGVAAVMTRSARRFVGPLTFEAITRRRVITDQFAPGVNADIEHIALATEAALLVVAPATANVIGKFAHGIADDFLTSLYLATRAPVLMAPAMNTHMLEHEAVRANLATLSARGVRFVEPGEGFLACGWIGRGRLAEPADVVAAAAAVLRPDGQLRGRTVLVTAGPTYEDVDAVRFLGNRSSGRMGFALAAEAAQRGARVLLVAGPGGLPPPAGVEVIGIRSAAEMHREVMGRADEADAVIMAAAVADYTPAEGARASKLTKESASITLTLTRTPDILGSLGRRRGGAPRPVLVGFAAEAGDPVARARQKLVDKGADLMVANDILAPGAGFEVDTNVAILVGPEGDEPLPLLSKRQVAGAILDRVERLLATRPAAGVQGRA
jgi:phosphopantothenoylcysteine decarboxylase / phosphopantothenate---cysteine ligase